MTEERIKRLTTELYPDGTNAILGGQCRICNTVSVANTVLKFRD